MEEADARQVVADALLEIAPEVDLALCDPDRPLAEQVDLDSMDVLELLTGIAERTQRAIPDGALGTEWTLRDLLAVLGR